MPATYPAVTVEFAPGIAPNTVPGPGDWVDISSRVTSDWSVKWGRFDEFSESGAGTASLTIANDDGELDPDGSGTYAGDLVAGCWFRIKAGTTTANTDVFYGHLSDDGVQIQASQYADQFVTVDLVDDLEQLANTDLPASVWVLTVEDAQPLAWWRLGEQSGTVVTDSSGQGYPGTYENGAVFNSRSGLVEGDDESAIEFPAGVVTNFTYVGPYAVIPTVVTAYPFTFRATIQTTAAHTGSARMVWMIRGPAGGIELGVNADDASRPGELYASITNGVTIRTKSSQDVTVNDGDAHDVEWVVTNASTWTLRVDGVDATQFNVANGSPTFPDINRATLGASAETVFFASAESGAFDGIIDEAMIFGSALAGATSTALHEARTAPWQGDLSGARIDHLLDAVAYDAANRDVATGNSTLQQADLGGGDTASMVRAVAKAEAGFVYIDHQDGGELTFIDRRHRWTASASVTSQATFGDSGSEVTYDAISLMDDRIINRASVQRRNGAVVVVEDAVSVASRRRTYGESGLLYETDAESEARATRIVSEKASRQRVPKTITLRPRKSTHSAWAHVFARKVNDRITVKWRPAYGGTYTFTCWIDGIAHRWSERGGLETTFWLTPVPYGGTGTAYWILGTSELGVDTRLGY